MGAAGSDDGPAVAADIAIEIAYALPDRQFLHRLVVPAGTTVGAALELARPLLAAHAPDPSAPVGIWGAVVERSRALVHGDRIEVYRPLPADPKDTRRRLARQGRTMGRDR
jgi:putative ubiquitin-RnfH superfamily antitoxin RatB of RatAB toxin-antitoxin module